MAKSPGHRKWPDHLVREETLDEQRRITIAGQTVADSSNVIRVDEDGHQPRFYFPRQDVRTDLLERMDKTTECPFKGKGIYFRFSSGDSTLEEVAWSYTDPYDEHEDLRDRIAFHEERPEIELS